jgi:cellulose biosynthesis protein BcsQ
MTARVITFYSYKGGVGRTMALVAVGAQLARWGRRVLLIDFDLEAPGLDPYCVDGTATHPGGVLDLLTGDAVDWRRLVRPAHNRPELEGRLHVLSAGDTASPSFSRRLQAFDWPRQFREHDLGRRLLAWRDEWAAAYDVVLLDSRTGLTDIGDVCTALLPDSLVCLFTGNQQSLDGVVAAAERARAVRANIPEPLPHLPVVPVLARWDNDADGGAREHWAREVPRKVAPLMHGWLSPDTDPKDVLTALRLPYRARFSLGEPIVTLTEPADDPLSLASPLRNLAALLAHHLTGVDELIRSPRDYAARADRRRDTRAIRLLHAPADAAYAATLRDALQQRQVELSEAGVPVVLWPADRRATYALLAQLDAPGVSSCQVLVREGAADTAALSEVAPGWARLPNLPLADLAAHLAGQAAPAIARPTDPRARYLALVAERHEHLLPFFPGASDHFLAEVFVELELDPVARERDALHLLDRQPRRLPDLLAHSVAAGRPGRHLVIGDPGAGKTTLLRHLCRTLAVAADGPLPAMLSLSRHAGSHADPLDLAAADLGDPALAAVLRAAADRPGGLYLLLDGLDEVDPAAFEATRAWINRVATGLPHAVVVVTSRPVAVSERGLGKDWTPVRVRGLSRPQQRTLLDKLLGPDDAAALREELDRRPRLADLGESPLLLTLLALVGREALARGGALPPARTGLYKETVDLLLRRGHCPEPRGMKDVRAARRVLRALSLRLHDTGGEAWSQAELEDHLRDLRREDAALAEDLSATWGSLDAFLRDVGHHSGVLGPHDPGDAPWRYLHRSLREYLVAEELAERGREAVDGWVERWKEAVADDAAFEPGRKLGFSKLGSRKPPNPARWGEVVSLLCGVVPYAEELLTNLAQANAKLAVHTLGNTDGLDAAFVFRLITGLPRHDRYNDGAWDGDDLAAALAGAAVPRSAATDLAWTLVSPDADATTVGLAWDVLDQLGAPPERDAFFRRCDKPLPGDWRPATCRVPAGTSWRGSPEGVGEDRERPRHRVTHPHDVWLTTTPITNADYRRLWPKHRGADDHPAVEVSWYAARLYAAWLGAELPTEAQWEHACRAGTNSAWSFGEEAKDLGDHAWFAENSGHSLHPVGQKLPNRWGLRDMHGLVLEWCHDSLAPYDDADHPRGPRRGYRCLRGGAFHLDAIRCGSACRSGGRPSWSYGSMGFRVLFSSPADGS